MTTRLNALAALVLAACHLATHAAGSVDAASDDIVSRGGPQDRGRYSRGELGILLPSYHRGPLYEAWRALNLPRAELEKEDRSPEKKPPPRGEDKAIDNWKAARGAYVKEAPRLELDIYRDIAEDAYGSFVNCTPGAFVLATQTLDGLRQDGSLGPQDVRDWVLAQDAVFEFCTHVPGAPKPPKAPSPLPASAPLKLRQLRQYQVASAHFYASNYPAAQSAFAAIAQDKDHPLRNWAALASLRSILREASLDLVWQRRWRELDDNKARRPKAEVDAAIALAADQSRAREAKALAAIEARVRAMLADAQWQPIHGALQALREQALGMLASERAHVELGAQLADFQFNPYRQGTLGRWEKLGDAYLDFGPPAPDMRALRRQQPFFDWIRTIQGCVDNVRSPNYTGRCETEHQHALDEWSRGSSRAWLVAALVTAPRLMPQNQAALEAALGSERGSPGWLTLHYHAARLLRQAGRADLARPMVERLLADRLPDASSLNLLRQQRVSMGSSLQDVVPWLLRRYPWQPGTVEPAAGGADADELLNRRLSTEDQLALAVDPSTPLPLRRQLAVSAWLRANLLENYELADRAARLVQSVVPSLQAPAGNYLAQTDADGKQIYMLRILMLFDVSPQAFRVQGTAFGQRRNAHPVGAAWCAWDGSDAKEDQRIQRMLPLPPLGVDQARVADELRRLREAGNASQWFVRQALAVARRQPDAADTTRYLRAALQTLDTEGCPHPQAEAVRSQIQQLLATR